MGFKKIVALTCGNEETTLGKLMHSLHLTKSRKHENI